jgi:hypothetical protein
VLLFLLIACSEIDLLGNETLDSQARWLSAKCPPTEICGPQFDPETLVIAWLDASKNDLCSVLTKYTSPDRSEIIPDYCSAVESYQIDAISVKETADKSNLKEVKIQGRLEFTLNGDSHTRRTWSILVEEIGGKWFVIDGYH